MTHYVYIVECVDSTYYCGYTVDLEKRILTHNLSKKGAKYTKARRPVKLVYKEDFPDKSLALKREHEIKKLNRFEKNRLINSQHILELM